MLMEIGAYATVKRIFDQNDLDRFALLSGDDNPIHVDPAFAARTRFGRTVAHGMLLYSAVCAVLGSELPGPATLQLEQELMFPAPTYVGEEVTIRVEVAGVQPATGTAELITLVEKTDGSLGLQGRTRVRLPGPQPVPPFATSNPESPTCRGRAQTSLGFHPAAPNPQPGTAFKGLEIGQWAETRRVFTGGDLTEYADLTFDRYGQGLGPARAWIPGGLLGGMFSYLLGTHLPGRGTNYLKQRLVFEAPAYAGEELTARVEIVRLRPEKQLVNLSTRCTSPRGRGSPPRTGLDSHSAPSVEVRAEGSAVCRGEALVLVSDLVGAGSPRPYG